MIRTMANAVWRVALASAVLCLAACGDSFDPASTVTDLRVTGARVEVVGKPGRANPDPGDTIEVSTLVIDRGFPPTEPPAPPPYSPPPLQWALVPCVPAPTVLPVPFCQDVLPCEGCEETPPVDPLALPVSRFAVPAEDELDDASRVVLQGTVCANGAPAGVDAIIRFLTGESDSLDPCQDPADEGRFISIEVPIESDPSNPNLNPTIAELLYNGQPWPPPFDQGVPRDQPTTGCASLVDDPTGLPRAGDPPAAITVTASDESFQEYTVDEMTLTEEMQVSWLADGGGFEFSFSFITDPARSGLILWALPSFPNPAGSLVRINVVMRDGRGGLDAVERGLCVLPADSAP